jgi:hypothetical protein
MSVTATRTHRRANRNFERGVPVVIDPEDLSDDESEALLSDPELTIREVEAPAKTAPAKKVEEPQLSAEERAAKVLAVIPELGDDEKNKDGSPNVKAVSGRVGFDVTKAEIEEALAEIDKANAS